MQMRLEWFSIKIYLDKKECFKFKVSGLQPGILNHKNLKQKQR